MKIWEIVVAISIPTLLITAVFYYMLTVFFKEEKEKRSFELQKLSMQNISAQRLQAYERIALFLERIRPTYLASSIEPQQTIQAYELALIKTIQTEFEHNLSQQVYINPETWKIIFSSKNATQNFIKQCVEKLDENASPQDLQQEIIKRSINENIPSNQAMLYVQKDVQGGF